MQLSAHGLTDVGCVRARNEDAFLVSSDPVVLAVADGMGGHEAGDVASALVIDRLRQVSGDGIDALVENATAGIHDANRILRTHKGRTIGTTIACALVAQDLACILWAGDSRVYRMRGGALERLTTDHSIVQQMVDAGHLTPDEAHGHPLSNRVTRAVGTGADIDIDLRIVALRDGDRLLLCSDGLTDCLTDAEIAAHLMQHDDETGCAALVAGAVARGAPDNVTVICATVSS